MNIKLSNSNKLIREKNGIVYIYDKNTCKCVFVTSEVYKLFQEANEENVDEKEFIDCFEDESDRKYIQELIIIMKDIGFIDNESYREKLKKDKFDSFDAVHLMITKRCNLNCKHCSSNCSIQEEEYLSYNQILNILSNLEKLNVKKLIITGGEPLIREDFFDLLKIFKERLVNTEFSLATNATLIDENIDKIIHYFDEINISIDGIDDETCSKIRGKGTFDKVIDSIKRLKQLGFENISLSMVVNRYNKDFIDEFEELNNKLGTKPILRTLISKGRAKENADLFDNDNSKYLSNIPSSVKNTNNNLLRKDINQCACDAFSNKLFIDFDGIAYTCPSLIDDRFKIIDMSDDMINKNDIVKAILYKLNEFNDIYKSYKDTKCENCANNIFCWSCPADFIFAKDSEAVDEWCDEVKLPLEKALWKH
jgi:radical SAM protein with 4Fe4S-binding SPASM domain